VKTALRAEFLKLRTTRTIYFLLAGIVAISVVTVLDPNQTAETFRKPFNEQGFLLFTSMLTRLLIFVLGVRLMTDEFRHGTIVPTLLATPRRGRVVGAKALVAGAAGVVAAALAWIAMTVTASVVASTEGTTLALDATAWQTFAGMLGAGAAWGVFGVLLGAIVRNQLAVTVGGLLWLLGIEDMFRGFLGDLGGYLPGQAGLLMVLAPTDGAAVTGLATILAYGTGFALLALRGMRRDIA
jgi:ABC-type transport system involved in multi-copper enzyme maturation permease subunit